APVRLPDGSLTDAVFVHQSQRVGQAPHQVAVERDPMRGTIAAVDWQDDAIIVPSTRLPIATLPGRPIRIHNDFKSSMYRVVDASRVDGDRLKLRMDRSSLLGEGRALGFEDGVVLNSVPIPFVKA